MGRNNVGAGLLAALERTLKLALDLELLPYGRQSPEIACPCSASTRRPVRHRCDRDRGGPRGFCRPRGLLFLLWPDDDDLKLFPELATSSVRRCVAARTYFVRHGPVLYCRLGLAKTVWLRCRSPTRRLVCRHSGGAEGEVPARRVGLVFRRREHKHRARPASHGARPTRRQWGKGNNRLL